MYYLIMSCPMYYLIRLSLLGPYDVLPDYVCPC